MTTKDIYPSKEQIKEFWERCGLVHINNPTQEAANSCESMAIDKPINGWYVPDYKNATSKLISLKETPNIDLNNLFKYAVPKEIISVEVKTWTCEPYATQATVWIDGKVGQQWNNDPALALFWAIYKVIHQ